MIHTMGRRILLAVVLPALLSACSSAGLRDAPGVHFFTRAGTVIDVLDYQNRLSRMNAYDYREARQRAQQDFEHDSSDEHRLRLVSALLHSDGSGAIEDWRRAEALLSERLQDLSEPVLDEALKVYAENLLAQIRHLRYWRSQSTDCQGELSVARDKLKELKMIEVKMMEPGRAIN